MSRRPRRNHTPAFKAKVALAAIRGDRTLAQLAEQFDLLVPVPMHFTRRWRRGYNHAEVLAREYADLAKNEDAKLPMYHLRGTELE